MGGARRGRDEEEEEVLREGRKQSTLVHWLTHSGTGGITLASLPCNPARQNSSVTCVWLCDVISLVNLLPVNATMSGQTRLPRASLCRLYLTEPESKLD